MIKKIITTSLILLLLSGSTLPVSAADNAGTANTAAQGLTIQQAVDMALASSNSLQKASISEERSKDVYDYAGYAMGGQMTPTGMGAVSSSVANFYNLMSSSIGWETAKRTRTATEDQITYGTVSAYLEVLNAGEKLSLAQKNLEIAEWANTVANVGWRVGTVSDYDRDSAMTALTAAQKAVAADEFALTTAYQALDKLVGLSADVCPVLSEKPEFSTLDPNTSLQAAISNGVDNNPEIYNLDQAVTLAQIAISTYNGSGDPLEAKNLDKTKAEVTASDTRDSIKQSVRTIYNNIHSLEQSITALQAQLKRDQENLDIVRTKVEIGLATKTDLLNAEATLQNDATSLDSNINTHELAKMALQKPWSVSGS